MVTNGYYKIEVTQDRHLYSYNFYFEKNLVKINRSIDQEYRLEVNNLDRLDQRNAISDKIDIHQYVDLLDSYVLSINTEGVFQLQEQLSDELNVSFVDFGNIEMPLSRNICFSTRFVENISFDYIFLNQFHSTNMESAASKLILMIKKIIEEDNEAEIKVRNVNIFEEFFKTNKYNSKYYGFLDNNKAGTTQVIFEVETTLLLNIFQVFHHIFRK